MSLVTCHSPLLLWLPASCFLLLAPVASAQTPPAYCNPCLYYSGDYEPGNKNSNELANELTTNINVAIFVPVRIPSGGGWDLSGLVFNVDAFNGGILDPQKAAVSIRQGMSAGEPGNVIYSANLDATVTDTGITGVYAVGVELPRSVGLLSGQTYWFSVVPQCVNTQDAACTDYPEGIFFLDNTFGANSYPGKPEAGISGQSLWYGTEGAVFNYPPVCTIVPVLDCQF